MVATLEVDRVQADATPPNPWEPAGDGESFVRSLYTDYGRLLLTCVSRLTGGDRYWAQDVVQETLLRAWKHADQLSPELGAGSLMPWLATVARHIVCNDWRSRTARPKEVTTASLAAVTSPDETEMILRRVVLDEALATLPPRQRTVVVELYLHGRTTQEVAEIVGVPPGTVKSRAYYATRALQRVLKRRDFTL